MDHRAKVSELCAQWGIANDEKDGIPEDQLGIAELVFHSAKGEATRVPATNMNRASRLLLEQVTRETHNRLYITMDEELRERVKDYFAERWPETPDPNRPLLFNLASCVGIDVTWKDGYWTRRPLR